MRFETFQAGDWRQRCRNVGWVGPKGVTQQVGSQMSGYATLTQPTWLSSGKLPVEHLDIQFPPSMQEASG